MEADWVQAQQIREKVEKGMDPDDAYAEVMRPKTKTATTIPVTTKKKANQTPKAKTRLLAWLEERADVIPEYKFHPVRRWRADYYLPEHKIIVEYDGLMHHGANHGHTSISGVMADHEKQNHAQAMGLRIFRANAKSIEDNSFFKLMQDVLETNT